MTTARSDLRHRAELFDFVAHHTRDAIFLAAPEGDIFYSNQAASRMFGYSAAEFLAGGLALIREGRGLPEAAPETEADAFPMLQHEEWMRHKAGHHVRVDASFARFRAGKRDRVMIIVHELGDGQKPGLDAEIGEASVEDVPAMIYVTDTRWRILWANYNKAIGSGYSVPELLGQQAPLRRYLGEESPHTLAEIEAALSGKGQWSGNLCSRRRNGEVYPIRAHIAVVEGLQPGEHSRVVILTDLSAARATTRVLHRLSHYDLTTGLPSRALFEEHVVKALGHGNSEKPRLYVLLLDIDSFGMVNEALGYEAADRVLGKVADRLRGAAAGRMFLSRHTGDTFAMLATEEGAPRDIADLIAGIRQAFHEPLTLNEHRFHLSVSMGVSCSPEDGEACDELLRAADVALQRVRKAGGDGYGFYRAGDEAASRRFIDLATPIREGLAKGEFIAHFQPIIDSLTWDTVSMEALARWPQPDGSWISPADFIPIAERSGAIRDIFDAVLRSTCRTLHGLDESGHSGMGATINISARQFADPSIPEQIIESLGVQDIDPARISLEITESVLMEQPEEKSKILEALRRAGIKIIIDDFGTGHSSFAYLKRFHVDGIKLDRLFVNDVPGDEKDENLVAMMLAMGNELDIPMVAEGVETQAQAEFLLKHGCARLQGFLIARPLSAEDFGTFLDNGGGPGVAPFRG